MWSRFCLKILFISALRTTLFAAELASPDFEKDVRPILEKNCLKCHGESTPQAQLDLRTAESALAGGKSGSTLVPGDSSESLLVSKVTSGSMPPGDARLSDQEISLIRLWIDRQGMPPGWRVSPRRTCFRSFRCTASTATERVSRREDSI